MLLRLWKPLSWLVLLVGLFVFTESTAWAHARLVQTEPPAGAALEQSPRELRLYFSEAVEPKFSEIALYDAQGVAREGVSFVLDSQDQKILIVQPPTLPVGTYTVVWKVLSAADGHVSKGSFAFGVGMPAAQTSAEEAFVAAPPSPLRLAVRWLGFLALMALVGGLLLRLLFATSAAIFFQQFKIIFWASMLLAVASGLAELILQAVTISNASFSQIFTQDTLFQLLFQTRYGLIWLLRLGLLITLALLCLRKASPWLMAAAGALILLSISLGGHSAALTGLTYLAIFADWGHLLAASLWVGGLLQLVFWLPGLRHMPDAERTRLLAELAPRFYSWAFFSAAVLLLTGFHLTYRHIPNLQDIWTTPYGLAFMAKHLLILALVALSAINLLWASPSLAKALMEKFKSFQRLVRLEALVAAIILFFAGALTLVPPPQQLSSPHASSQAQPVELAEQVGDFMIHLTLSSDRVGTNEFDVLVMRATGEPIPDAERVSLKFTYLERDLGVSRAEAQAGGDGHYRLSGSFLSLVGRWRIGVDVRLAAEPQEIQADFEITVRDSAASEKRASPVETVQIEAGRSLFVRNCASCHGEAGRGDGAASAGLTPRPADLLLHRGHHTDEDLIRIIKGGKGPAMPGFVDQLTDEQIRQIILYIRSLK